MNKNNSLSSIFEELSKLDENSFIVKVLMGIAKSTNQSDNINDWVDEISSYFHTLIHTKSVIYEKIDPNRISRAFISFQKRNSQFCSILLI